MLLLLGGCNAVGPDYQTPAASEVQALAAFPSAGEAGTFSAVMVSEPPELWWQALQDADLDALIALALAANSDRMLAIANVEAARALLRQVETRHLPSVDANGTVRERRDAQAAQRKADAHNQVPTRSLATIGVDLLWEIDLFGRVRRSVEAAAADLDSLEAVRNNVLLSLLSTVASSYIDLRGAQMRLAVAERNVAVQQQTLDLVLLLTKEGAATELDVARARTQLLTSQATIPVQRRWRVPRSIA